MGLRPPFIMNEGTFTQSIHNKLNRTEIGYWKINDNFAGGVPDAFYRLLNAHQSPVWVEYKHLHSLPKRLSTVVIPKLSAQQKLWLSEAVNADEKAWVVLQIGTNQIFVYENIAEWTNGVTTEHISNNLIDKASFVVRLKNHLQSKI